MTAPPRSTRLLLLTAIVVSLVGCDQATKYYAVQKLKPLAEANLSPVSYFGDIVRIHFIQNDGAFLGLMGNLSDQVRFWTLTVGNAVILGWVAIYVVMNRRMDRWMFFALSLIVAGGIGNLIDRMRLDCKVIDFLNLGIGSLIRTGIFNVADVAITAGFFMLMPVLFQSEKKREPMETALGS
jgi:signal peptidase II